MDNYKLTSEQIVDKPYKLGVALSGGGARGLAHAGALLAIEHAGLKPDVIAGVSAGAVIAVLYAAGVKPMRMAEMFARCKFKNFSELSLGSGGVFNIDKFRNFILRSIGNYKNLEDLKIPTYIGVTDLDNGQPVEFHTGEIGDRMVASCSIPVVFKPINIDGVNYVDGGVLRNHPAWIIREKCQTLIGVNVSPLRPHPNKKPSIIDTALRTYQLMAKANQAQDMDLCDVSVMTTDIIDNKVFNLKHIKDVFLSGFYHTRDELIKAGLWNPTTQDKLNS